MHGGNGTHLDHADSVAAGHGASRRGLIAIRLSLLVSLLMLVGKWLAFRMTGSVAILSDAVESVVHLAATGIAAFSIWYSRQPADPQHLYGHGKIAYFSAGFEGALILVAALAIIVSGVDGLIFGVELQQLGVGIAITGGLGLVNLALGLYLVRVGRREGALALVANGHHVLTDMWTSLGVVAGVALVWLTDIPWLDPLVAIVVGAQIAWTASSLLRRSYHGLMDRGEERVTEHIIAILQDGQNGGIIAGFHQLKHREVDGVLWVDVHLLLPGRLELEEAHARATTLERRLFDSLPHQRIHFSTHLEPIERHAEHHPAGHEPLDPLSETSSPPESGAPA